MKFTLRQKVLMSTGMVMVVVFLLVMLPLIAETILVHGEREQAEASLAATVFRLAVEDAMADPLKRGLDHTNPAVRRVLENRLQMLTGRIGAVTSWVIVGGQGEVIVHSPDLKFAEDPKPNAAALRQRFQFALPIFKTSGGPWTFHGQLASGPVNAFRGMGTFLASFLVGTLVLLGVLFLLLDHLVLRPLDRLLAASRAVASHGAVAPVRGAERSDEMGELVRGFNAMSQEVFEHRRNLEAKVRQATAEYERAQKRLVLADRIGATGRLAAGIAHEINNPLGGMLNATRTLEKNVEPGTREAEYVKLILEGLARVQDIVGGMLSFARGAPSVQSVRVGEAIDSALQFCRHRIERENIELVRDTPGRLPPVAGDAHQLSQVFLNLIVNAVDALADVPSDERTLRVEVERAGGDVLVRVADSGPGMDEETRKQAFELFFTTKDPEKGTGLGLPICHNIVTGHGGAMEIESAPGEGTTVTVTLPIEAGTCGAELHSADGGENLRPTSPAESVHENPAR